VIGIINALAIANPLWKITPVILYLKRKKNGINQNQQKMKKNGRILNAKNLLQNTNQIYYFLTHKFK